MARGEVEALVAGGRHRLAMPLGAIDDVARATPELGGLLMRLLEKPVPGRVTWAEARAVVEAGIRHADARVSVEAIYAHDGLGRVYSLAAELLLAAFEGPDAPGEGEAGGTGTPPPARDGTSPPTSGPAPSSA